MYRMHLAQWRCFASDLPHGGCQHQCNEVVLYTVHSNLCDFRVLQVYELKVASKTPPPHRAGSPRERENHSASPGAPAAYQGQTAWDKGLSQQLPQVLSPGEARANTVPAGIPSLAPAGRLKTEADASNAGALTGQSAQGAHKQSAGKDGSQKPVTPEGLGKQGANQPMEDKENTIGAQSMGQQKPPEPRSPTDPGAAAVVHDGKSPLGMGAVGPRSSLAGSAVGAVALGSASQGLTTVSGIRDSQEASVSVSGAPSGVASVLGGTPQALFAGQQSLRGSGSGRLSGNGSALGLSGVPQVNQGRKPDTGGHALEALLGPLLTPRAGGPAGGVPTKKMAPLARTSSGPGMGPSNEGAAGLVGRYDACTCQL